MSQYFRHSRQSVRLVGYDYSQNGMYFITICAYQRQNIFGEIQNKKMILSVAGKMVQTEWLRTSLIRPNIFIDDYQIMPNHVHGIIAII